MRNVYMQKYDISENNGNIEIESDYPYFFGI